MKPCQKKKCWWLHFIFRRDPSPYPLAKQLLREEEGERQLSLQHGEAAVDADVNVDVSSASNKRQSDAEIAKALNKSDADADASSNDPAKKKRKRIVLTEDKLTGPVPMFY
eukprot:49009_1